MKFAVIFQEVEARRNRILHFFFRKKHEAKKKVALCVSFGPISSTELEIPISVSPFPKGMYNRETAVVSLFFDSYCLFGYLQIV
jgi:hypothetical protein